jgi:HD-GYP domain-containing protein (c-di-GMP phosphodiesterase class II)
LEYELIKSHVRAGYDILKRIEFPWPIADIILQHHERLDGSGYPQGLKVDQIMQLARILAVADVFETIASHRPYRPALGLQPAIDEIRTNRGKLYDPQVVDVCLTLVEKGEFNFEGTPNVA